MNFKIDLGPNIYPYSISSDSLTAESHQIDMHESKLMLQYKYKLKGEAGTPM